MTERLPVNTDPFALEGPGVVDLSQSLAAPAPGHVPANADLPTAEEWAAHVQRDLGCEPSMSEYRSVLRAGLIAVDRKSVDPSLQQMSEGAKHLATGAREYFNAHVAPAAVGAARTMQSALAEKAPAVSRGLTRVSWSTLALLPVTALSIIALFLPAVTISGYGDYSVNFFANGPTSDGNFMVVPLIALMVITVLATLFNTVDRCASPPE